MSISRLARWLLCSLVVLTGCRGATVDGRLPARRVADGSGKLVAGASRVDITPLPGFPMAGHAIGGKISRGYWTRLNARAFYLEDAEGTPLVMVSCDLWAVPAGLADRIAEKLADGDLDHIGRENIILAATHTHQSQGNFATAGAFNDFAQPLPGFDPHLFDFLADRITGAIATAYAQRQPASIHRTEARLQGFFRNRSMEAFLLNLEHDEILAANRDLPACTPADGFPDPRACQAVDPRVTVMRVEATDSQSLIGMMAFVAVHPTVMTHDVEVYSSDLFGTASVLAEEKLHRSKAAAAAAPVVALFNGAEGDITTTWEQQDRRSLLRLSNQLAGAITSATSGGDPIEGTFAYQFETVAIGGACFEEVGGRKHCTPSTGVPGASAFGGAEDGRTVLDDLGFSEGRRGTKRGAHGAKLPAFDLDFGGVRLQLTEWMTDSSALPTAAPLGVYRFGDVLIATLPGEFTTTMGKRISTALQQTVAGTSRPLLVGLANEYMDYFTTPEEYDRQSYEGGMTMYGQAAGTLVKHHLVDLATRLEQGSTEPVSRDFRYRPGRIRKFRLDNVGAPLYLADDGNGAVLQDLANGDPRRDFPCVCWQDGARRMKDVRDGQRATAAVRIEDAVAKATLSVDGRLQDDSGIDFLTVVASANRSTSRWCTYWMPPEGIASDESVVFRVTDLDDEVHYSAPFEAGARFQNGCLQIEP